MHQNEGFFLLCLIVCLINLFDRMRDGLKMVEKGRSVSEKLNVMTATIVSCEKAIIITITI